MELRNTPGAFYLKLKDVKLCKLLALERFDHVANDIEFPDLDDITVAVCPVFKSFYPGFVHTPILDHVKLYDDVYASEEEEEKVTMWKGNLNSTIQHLHEDQQQRRRQNKLEEEEESGDENDIKEES